MAFKLNSVKMESPAGTGHFHIWYKPRCREHGEIPLRAQQWRQTQDQQAQSSSIPKLPEATSAPHPKLGS